MDALVYFYWVFQNYFGLNIQPGTIEETSPLCRKQYESLDSTTLLQMYDATAKSVDGLMSISPYHLGNYEQCYNIVPETDAGGTYGKYCMGKISHRIAEKFVQKFVPPELANFYHKANSTPVGIYIGVCVPDQCTPTDIEKLSGFLTIDEKLCHSKNNEPALNTGAYITIIILALCLVIVLVASVYEVLQTTYKWKARKIILAFSAVSNSKKLFSSSPQSHHLMCLNGIKAITALWIMWGHAYAFVLLGPFANFIVAKKFMESLPAMLFVSSAQSVDTFLAVTGLVTVFAFLTIMETTNIKFNIPMYYLHRYIRLTPVLAIIVLMRMTLLPYLGSGPFWFQIDENSFPCKDDWWTTLLYIQNYVPPEKHICVPHAWYLCVDVQLCLLSPPVLILLHRKPKTGVKALFVLLLLSCLIPFTVGYVNEYTLYPSLPYATHMLKKNIDVVQTAKLYVFHYFTATHTRFGPYIVGMIFGYALYQARKAKMALRPTTVILMWTVGIGGLSFCIFGNYSTLFYYDRLVQALQLGFWKHIWATFVCIIIFMCATGHGGFINQFLSLGIFQFLSKILLSLYLIHVGVFSLKFRTMRSSITLSHDVLWLYFMGYGLLSIIISIVCTLVFEAPAIQLEKILFSIESKEKVPEKKID